MKRLILLTLLSYYLCTPLSAQESFTPDDFANPAIVQDEDMLIGSPYDLELIFPLNSDGIVNAHTRGGIVYPLLIVNGVIIRDENQLNNFRNNYLDKIRKRKKFYTKEKATKMGIKDAPRDGVVWVTTRKGVVIEL